MSDQERQKPESVHPGWAWVLRLAWRDSRGQRKLLLLFVLGVVVGIAALTAITSFRHNLEATVENKAKTLLGADLEFSSHVPFSDKIETFIDSLGGERADEVRLGTMAYFPKQEQARLVQVRFMDGDFPFYGELVTEPAGLHPQDFDTPEAIAEDTLLRQYGVDIGDTVKIGDLEFRVAGRFLKVGGESAVTGLFAPRIFVAKRFMEPTGLVQKGSLYRYVSYLKFEGGLPEAIAEQVAAEEKGLLAAERVHSDTVADQKRRLGRSLSNLTSFLQLTGFIALLLGGLGVAGAVQVYLKQKMAQVAVLRCLGCPLRAAFQVYALQAGAVGLAGAIGGAALGLALQYLLPTVVAPFLPLDVELFVSWRALFFSMGFGWLVTTLFAFSPLLEVRRASPLRALRAGFEEDVRGHDPWRYGLWAVMLVLLLSFCLTQSRKWEHGLGFAGGLLVALAALAGVAWLLRLALRKLMRSGWPYAIRQGFSNLYRPQNRTLFLMTTLGTGAFLLCTLYLAREQLLGAYRDSALGGQPNLILFDIQPDQIEGVRAIVEEMGLPIVETAPIVTMRVDAINGVSREAIRNTPDHKAERWALNREYRSTFRSELISSETLIDGEFVGHWDGQEPVPVTIEEGMLDDLDVSLGDQIEWNVQGIPINTKIVGIRKVDWNRVRTNFFFVFPAGVLEEAPLIYALVSRVPDRTSTAALQTRLARDYANVAAIDLTLVLNTLTDVVDKATFVIQFMSAFTLVAGVFVLTGAIYTSRYQRARECALLRAMGGSAATIQGIIVAEYALLGLLAGLTGALLSIGAAWGLATFVFEAAFRVPYTVLAIVAVGLAALTVLVGWYHSRDLVRQSPLAVLRSET